MQACITMSRKKREPLNLIYNHKKRGMKLKQIIARSAVIAGLTFASGWTVDTANAKVTFSVSGPFGTVHGSFQGLKATIKFNEKDLAASSIRASIDAKTVKTGIGKRDKDLCN